MGKWKLPRVWRSSDWLPFAFWYNSNYLPTSDPFTVTPGPIDTFGVGWRRWVLFYYRKGAYDGIRQGFYWCNYFGTGEGG